VQNLKGPIKNALLSADCDYTHILINPKIIYNGIVVPHYGAKLVKPNIHFAPLNHCLIYSYGLKQSGMKTHLGHPTPESVDFHTMNGWINPNVSEEAKKIIRDLLRQQASHEQDLLDQINNALRG
jgi:hypothetical protein